MLNIEENTKESEAVKSTFKARLPVIFPIFYFAAFVFFVCLVCFVLYAGFLLRKSIL